MSNFGCFFHCLKNNPTNSTNEPSSLENEDDDEFDDILPDTNIDRERTLTGKLAIGTFVIVAVFITLAFCTPNWIEGDPRIYGTKVQSRLSA